MGILLDRLLTMPAAGALAAEMSCFEVNPNSDPDWIFLAKELS